MHKCRGFSFLELIVTAAILSMLAAILFPVFARAKASAVQTDCLSHFRQVNNSVQLYLGDYDESFMPVNHDPGAPPSADKDRTWVQLLLPYIGNFRVFHCPADASDSSESQAIFDQDLLPRDLFSRFYTASMHVNLGYNFQYLAPIFREHNSWISEPKTLTSLADPSDMLLFVDSVWLVADGRPLGGGSWLVSPPCRYESLQGVVFDTISATPVTGKDGRSGYPQVFEPTPGWEPETPLGAVYGGAWPWHSGRATVSMVDGSTRSLSMEQLGSGCEIRPQWRGNILDRRRYLWSPE